MPDIEQLVSEVTDLVSLPEIYLEVRRLMDDEHSTIDDFAQVIVVDPNLSARVLKLVNSSYFGLSEPVDSITRAIGLIGVSQLHSMVLTVSAVSCLDLPNDILPLKPFWHSSLYTGILAQQLAERLELPRSDRLFIAGLLHEAGHLVLCARLPDHAREIATVSMRSGKAVHLIQREMLDCHYGDIGAMLLASWNLPKTLQTLIRWQPEPLGAPEMMLEVALLHLAHFYADQNTVDETVNADDLIDPEVRALINLTQDEINSALDIAHEVSIDVGERILL